VQITLIKLSGYREWTESLGPDREHLIQEVQGKLHSVLSRTFSAKGAIAHPLRYDLMIAVTNTLTVDDHLDVLRELQKISPVPVMMAIASGENTIEAERRASKLLNSTYNSHQVIIDGEVPDNSEVCIVHADLAESIRLLTRYSVYETYEHIMNVYRQFRRIMTELGGIALYLGGDNMIGITTPRIVIENIEKIRKFSKENTIRIGIGVSSRPREAMKKATQALDELRQERKLEIRIEA